MRNCKLWLAVGWLVAFSSPVYAEDYAPNEVLVKWADLPGSAADVSVVRVSDVPTALALFAADPEVAYVEPNYRRFINVEPDDTYYTSGLLTHLEQTNDADIDAAAAWDISTGDRAIVVAVIDTGVDIDHPDLVDNIWTNPREIADNAIDDDQNGYIDDVTGWDFADDDNDVSPLPTSASFNDIVVLHGTHVAGTIGAAGNNAIGITGVNWQVSIMPIKVFDDDGNSSISQLVDAIDYAMDNGADVLNMSFGGYSSSDTEATAVAEAIAAGAIVVAAAGNDALDVNDVPSYPVCYPGVIGVSAVDSNDDMAWFTNYGTDCVDVAAPGDDILSTYYTDDPDHGFTSAYGYLSGTSMSTPVVSGMAALLLALDDTLTNTEITEAIVDSTDDIGLPELGSGRVNLASTVTAALHLLGPDPVTISAYHSEQRTHQILAELRSRDNTPYFRWNRPASATTVDGYYVYFGRKKRDPVQYGRLQPARSFTPRHKLHGNGVTYHLRVKALDSAGHVSRLSQFTYAVDRKVKRPTWGTATVLSGQTVELRWNKPSGEHVQRYKLYRSTQRHGQYRSLSGNLTGRSYRDATVTSGQTYYYKVRSVDDLGNVSSLSAEIRVRL